MKNKISLFLLSIFILTVSCSSPKPHEIDEPQQPKVILNNSDLSGRINTDNLGVVGIKEAPDDDPGSFNGLYRKSASDVASNIPITLIAEISAPVYEGVTLKATHVALNGNYAYVSYNVEGSKYLGGIDVINISDPIFPVIESQAILPGTDISSLAYYNNALYIAGATNSNEVDESNPAVLIKMDLENGLPTDKISLFDMSSYVATDIIANNKGIYAVSGVNGNLVKVEFDQNSNRLIESVELKDLRSLGMFNDVIVTLSGTEGLNTFNSDNLNEIRKITTGQDIAESKRTIDFYNNNILVAEGKKGLKAYDINSGNNSATIDLPTVTDVDQNEVVTNAVTVTKNHIFMANGAAGLAVHDLKEGISNITKTGTLEIDGSANYVKSSDDYIFVAGGAGGLKILKIIENESNSNGTTEINCSGLSAYVGGSWLNINSNDAQGYSGSASLKGVNINDDLTFCGSLAVQNGLNINSNGNFYMKGSLVQGNVSNKWDSFNINNNATLYIEGSLVIYGNMILNDGAKIEFLGSGSSVTIYGDVTKNGNITITGNYTDTFNKL